MCNDVKFTNHVRQHHSSGSASTAMQPAIGENDYLLTTRSCTDIDNRSDRSNHSRTPLIATGETPI